jgi:hypothetical protein
MTRQSRNVDREASLELSLAAMKSLVSDYALRARQAEELASRALLTAMTDTQVNDFANMVAGHMDARARERSIQQQALLQATVVALGAALNAEGEQQKTMLANMLRDLTSAVQHLELQTKVRSHSK